MHLLEVVGSFSEKIRPGSCTRNLKWWEKLYNSLGWWRMMRVSIKMVVYTDEKISTPVTLKKQVIRYRYCNRYILGLLWILKRNSDTRRRDSLSLRLKSCLISLFHFLCVKKKSLFLYVQSVLVHLFLIVGPRPYWKVAMWGWKGQVT